MLHLTSRFVVLTAAVLTLAGGLLAAPASAQSWPEDSPQFRPADTSELSEAAGRAQFAGLWNMEHEFGLSVGIGGGQSWTTSSELRDTTRRVEAAPSFEFVTAARYNLRFAKPDATGMKFLLGIEGTFHLSDSVDYAGRSDGMVNDVENPENLSMRWNGFGLYAMSGVQWTSTDGRNHFGLDVGVGALAYEATTRYHWNNRVDDLNRSAPATQWESQDSTVRGILPMARLGVEYRRTLGWLTLRARIDVYTALDSHTLFFDDGSAAGDFAPTQVILSVGPMIRF